MMNTNLSHLPDAKQDNIRTLVEIIQDEFEQVVGFANGKKKHSRISLIILFGSYAKGGWVEAPAQGYVSDYDVLVLLSNADLVEEYQIWQSAEERSSLRLKAPVNILVHTHAEVNDKIQQGHYFFTDIKKEGIQLYQHHGAVLCEPGVLSAEEARQIAQQHYDHWFKGANSFLLNYGHCIDRDDLSIAAFELHQATERLFTCILLVFTNYRPKSHNLKLLHNLAAQQYEALTAMFPQENKFHRRCFELLKGAYIDARYSAHYSISEEELLWLEGQVRQLQTLTEQVCLEKIAAF